MNFTEESVGMLKAVFLNGQISAPLGRFVGPDNLKDKSNMPISDRSSFGDCGFKKENYNT